MQITKILDAVVFSTLFVLAVKYYAVSPTAFDLISIAAMLYVMARNPDVNTVTLISIILFERVIDSAVLYAIGDNFLNAYFYYPTIAFINGLMLFLVIVRPVLLSRYGPQFLRKHKRLTMTHQDAMIAWLYFAHILIPLLTLAEHIVRNLDDINFKPMFFYLMYKPSQLAMAVIGIMILYFMTFEKSKEAREEKRRNTLDA